MKTQYVKVNICKVEIDLLLDVYRNHKEEFELMDSKNYADTIKIIAKKIKYWENIRKKFND